MTSNLCIPFLLLLTLLLEAPYAASTTLCVNPVPTCDNAIDYFPEKIEIVHASRTIKDLIYTNTFVDFTITARGPDAVWKYRLVRCGCNSDAPEEDRQVVFTSPVGIFINEGPTLGLFQGILPSLDTLRYVGEKRFIFSPAIRQAVDDGNIFQVPSDPVTFIPDYTQLSMDPLLALSFIGEFTVNGYVSAMTGKPFLVVAEVTEPTALGRAEWMKLIGLVLGIPEVANRQFEMIESKYMSLKQMAQSAKRLPSVFFNYPFSFSFSANNSADENYQWFVPSEKQYTTDLIRDAGGNYAFANDGGEFSRSLNFSSVLANFRNHRFLVNSQRFPLASDRTLEEFINEPVVPAASDDESFENLARELDAVRCGNVWSSALRITEDGQASDFFESAAFRPDRLLGDYIQILHPYLNVKTELTYLYSYGPASKDVVGSRCPYAILEGDPPTGTRFIDKGFSVPNFSRFEIEGMIESRILPRLRRRLRWRAVDVEISFSKNADASSGIALVVRIAALKRKLLRTLRSNVELRILRRILGENVSQIFKFYAPEGASSTTDVS